MTFETRTIDELCRIAAAGGGFTIDIAVRSTDDVCRIAACARSSGAQLTLQGLRLRAFEDLVRIAAAGKGCVKLEE